MIAVNQTGVMLGTKTICAMMLGKGPLSIVNISSVSAKVGAAYNSAYASSKAAVLGFTRSVARETAALGITVNAVCPWHVDTELVRESMGKRAKMFGKSAEEVRSLSRSVRLPGPLVPLREMIARELLDVMLQVR